MALGYIDPESGTYIYGDDDPAGPLSDVLNNGALAEHNARLADRQRLDELEDAQFEIHNIVASSFITLASGYAFEGVRPQIVRRIGSRVEFSLRIEKTSGVLAHGVPVGKVAFAWSPIPNSEWQLVGQQSGGAAVAAGVSATLNGARDIVVLSPNGTSNILAVSGFYHTI